MLYKISSMGYFGGVAKVSKGPWFRDFYVEDDGLDWFYTFIDGEGKKCYLLSNNMAVADREHLGYLYKTMWRNNWMSWGLGLYLSFETVNNVGRLAKMAKGWKYLNLFLIAYLYKSVLMKQTGDMYGPVMGAYLRKYSSSVKRDLFEIKDAKKEYFYIDTSEYMNYDNKDLADEYHVHHGPQPVSISKFQKFI